MKVTMNNEEQKFINAADHVRPSFEVFEKMDEILVELHEKTDQLMNKIEGNLLEGPTVRV